jgi:Domain of Unknown Function (DUF1080)
MQRRPLLSLIFAVALAATLTACSHLNGMSPGQADWETLIDGDKGLDNFNRLGDANWRAEGGAIVADKGKVSYLVTRKSYGDFMLVAEFWAATDTNSGIFIRASDANKITADSSYEVNIWDIRPEPKYGTGAIVDFAAVPVPITNKAGGRWNTFEIEARGPVVTVKLNGQQTVVMNNGKFPSGPFALQYGPGVQGAVGGPIKWRKVMIKPL